MSRKKQFAIVGAVVVCVALLGGWLLYEVSQFDYAEHVSHVDWLPAEASDISYYRDFRWRAWEFNISEAGFQAWANKNEWPVREVSGGDLSVPRYLKSLRNRGLVPKGDDWVNDEDHCWQNGWFCSEYDGELIVGYDRDNGRAYFLASH